MAIVLFLVYLIFTLGLLYMGTQLLAWEIGSVIYLIAGTFFLKLPLPISIFLWTVVVGIILILRVAMIKNFVTDLLYKQAKASTPKLSKSEEEALNAGDTWLEKDIFQGKPDWNRLSSTQTELSPEESAFLNNETETLCAMLNDWDMAQQNDMPEAVWNYLKENGFFGLVIDKKYGGKGFSAKAHSDIVAKIATRSGAAAVTTMVPNSLGPGELLQFYGTDAQKDYYLPRLAKGEDIPCFALTEPNAGSDATSIESEAIVVEKKIEGQTILGLNLTFNKRWITLSPIATLIGLAVQLKDPDGLLNGVGQEGITCILIPKNTKKLEIGNRHLAAHQGFMNGTIRGKNIFVPIDNIIGGQAKAGQGWQMLVECLSIGRSISLPALALGTSSISYLTTGAFARLRRQFNVEIAQFEGIEEKLAEIAGLNYLINSTRLLTISCVNEHKKPSVASAITKYLNTELGRIVLNDAMDVHAGRAVVVGPRNYLYSFYQSIPVCITVEGANIMTRNLLIFGQGSIACHPFIRDEFYAISHDDKQAFSELIWKHITYFMQNMAKTISTAWTAGIFIRVPRSRLKRQYQKLSRLSYAFAWIADLSLLYLGGKLKRKERLSARLADALGYLYMAMAALRFNEANHEHPDFALHAKWATNYCFYQAQKALIELSYNFPSRILGYIIRLFAFPNKQSMLYPNDKLSHELAKCMVQNNAYRNLLKKTVFVGTPQDPVGRMEYGLQLLIDHEALYKKVGDFKQVKWRDLKQMLNNKVKEGSLSPEEKETLLSSQKARWDAMLVDEFAFDKVGDPHSKSLADELKTPLD